VTLGFGHVGRVSVLVAVASALWAAGETAAESPEGDNAEVQRLADEDQEDRRAGPNIDWSVVKPRDDARLERIKELYKEGALRTGRDWLNAALILQHSNEADDYLLAHEMCVAALALGESRAKWLAAASEDRFLMAIGRKQRFGTQYVAADQTGAFRLADTDDDVSDELRKALGAPPLADAKARADQLK